MVGLNSFPSQIDPFDVDNLVPKEQRKWQTVSRERDYGISNVVLEIVVAGARSNRGGDETRFELMVDEAFRQRAIPTQQDAMVAADYGDGGDWSTVSGGHQAVIGGRACSSTMVLTT